MLLLIILPFFTSYLMRTVAWQTILADNAFVAERLRDVGLLGEDGRLLATTTAVIAGITYNFLPFMALPLYVALEKIDRRLIEAATDLYAVARAGLRRVTMPLALPGIFAGTLLTFIPAVGDYINAQLLGTSRQYMIGNVIQSKFLVVTDYPAAAALSFLLMAVLLIRVSSTRGCSARATSRRRSSDAGRPLRDYLLGAWSVAALVYLFIPIAVVVAFSFNDPSGRFNLEWAGSRSTTGRTRSPSRGWARRSRTRCDRGDLDGARRRARDVHGARARALPLHRARRHGLLRLPPAGDARGRARRRAARPVHHDGAGDRLHDDRHRPHDVQRRLRRRDDQGALQGMDTHLEEAAADLGANEWTAFRKVTLPLIAPGVAAAALLAFALSVDDFVITNFTAGQTSTFPLFIYGAARQGVPPQVNVLATALLVVVLVLMALNVVVQRRRARADAVTSSRRGAAVNPGLAQ